MTEPKPELVMREVSLSAPGNEALAAMAEQMANLLEEKAQLQELAEINRANYVEEINKHILTKQQLARCARELQQTRIRLSEAETRTANASSGKSISEAFKT